MGHSARHVLQADWNGRLIILKSKEDLELTFKRYFSEEDRTRTHLHSFSQFMELLNQSVAINYFNNEYPPDLRVLRKFARSCDREGDGFLDFNEALHCWHLTENHEFMLSLLLDGNPAVPKQFGFCGPVFAQEYASSKPLRTLAFARDPRSWRFRARMAIALIEMVEHLERTRYGTLYLCDMKESNFGFIEVNGKYIAKPIDLDLTWLASSLWAAIKKEKPTPCSDAYDCQFVNCLVECDRQTQMCSGELYTNNLQARELGVGFSITII